MATATKGRGKGGLTEGRAGATVQRSKSRNPEVAPRPKTEPSDANYSGRLAIRLRHLRESRGWTVAQLREHLKEAGRTVPVSSIYAYELGKEANGVDLPWDLVPVYAEAFGFKTASGLLPAE